MNSSINDLKKIFERNLKWKLNQKAKTSTDEFKLLLNNFRFYDKNLSGIIGKEEWKKAILKIGLIGFSEEKLNNLFQYYSFNQNKDNNNNNFEYINYKQFSQNLLYNTSIPPIIIKRNNYFDRDKKLIKNINYSYDFKNNVNEENTKDKNVYNYRINVNINNEQNISNFNDVNEENNKINNENNLNNNKSFKIKNIKIKNNNNIFLNGNNTINIKYFIKNIIDIFRNKINKDNGVTYYTLLQNIKLKTEYEQNPDILSISKLSYILKESNLNFTPKELQSLFCILDFNDTGFISLNKFLKAIKGYLNDFRKNILINIFNNQIDINKKGKISVYYFKNLYNYKNHPDVLIKKFTEKELLTQFNYTFDIFCKINKVNGDITCSHFVKYYEGISPSIPDDMYFKEIINNVWLRTNNYKQNNLPTLNNQNINFNLDKSINRSASTPLISFNNTKLNTISNTMNNNNNFYDEKLKMINNNYLKYKNNTINDNNKNRLILKRVNLTPINSIPKNNTPLILNNSPNYNLNNYQLLTKSNFIHYDNLNINKSENIDAFQNKYSLIKKNYSHIIGNNIITEESSKDKYNYSQIVLNHLRNILIKRGNKSIFYLQRMLTNCDINRTGVIYLSQLNNIFRAYNFNLYFNDIKLLFELFDTKKVGIIKYDNLIKEIVGKMNNKRKNLIIRVYDNFNKDSYGFINIKEIRNKYNSYKHPEVIKGNKTHEEVYGDFLECIEIYREYICNINKKNVNYLSFNEFLEFFDEISMFISDDYIFELLITGCWDVK